MTYSDAKETLENEKKAKTIHVYYATHFIKCLCLFYFSQQEALLEDLRTDIPVHFNFLFSDSHVEVISGKQEGKCKEIIRICRH